LLATDYWEWIQKTGNNRRDLEGGGTSSSQAVVFGMEARKSKGKSGFEDRFYLL
jgi:hypothetical protein